MLKQSSSILHWSVTLVVAVVAGVALLTMGRGLPNGGQVMATMTTLTTAEASPASSGLRVALTATITPATAIGTVQFMAGTTNLGNPVIVTNGIASETTPSLATGSHPLTAVFIPAYPVAYAPSTAAYSPSTSPAVVFVVPGAIATTTALATSPAGQAAPGTSVTLTATITPATAIGTVQFKDGTTNLGNPVIVTNGAASGFTSALPVGSHQLVAVFTPTNQAAFSPSTSPTVILEVTEKPALTQLQACLTAIGNCQPRAG